MKRLLNWLLAELRGESQTFSDEEKIKLRYNVWQVERWNDDVVFLSYFVFV